MDFDERERVDYLLKTIKMIMTDAERDADANPDGSSADFSMGFECLAELRQLTEDAL